VLPIDLPTTVLADYSNGMREIADRPYNRPRTINIRFIRQPDDRGYEITAWGSTAFVEDGGGGYRGLLTASSNEINAAIGNLRQVWMEKVIRYAKLRSDGSRYFPFVDEWDLATGPDASELDAVGLHLARAGHTLYTLLFRNGNEGLKEIGDALTHALRSGSQIISVESDDVFVPWSMLYVDPDGGNGLWGRAARWSLDGFWGYQHLVEHALPRMGRFDSRILLPIDRAVVGLNVNLNVDGEYPPTPCMRSIIQFFENRADTIIRRRKDDLAEAMQDPAFPDHISFFGCHGQVGGTAGVIDEQPYLQMEDGEKISSSEFVGWLCDQSLPTRPVVFINACQGGQLSTMFYPAFGRYLLAKGARCLIGPQLDLPRAFAREYVTRMFDAFLEPSTRLGDVVRTLTREFATAHGNPLGLMFSMYRGIDVHVFPLSAKP
jgi:hypothetical protein